MICNDCEMEVEKLTKEGICEACERRKIQSKYIKKIYVPLKDIKGTREYKIAMAKRLNWSRRPKAETKIEKENVQEDENNSIKLKYYKEVSEDIQESFRKNNITDEYLKFDVKQFIENLYMLLQENNYIEDARIAENIFNATSIDYLHTIENCDWYTLGAENTLYREKALLELRRPTKIAILYYKMLGPIIEHIKADEELMQMIQSLRIDFIKNKEKIEKGEYIPKQSNVLKKDTDTQQYSLYDCRVPCYNLYGNAKKSILRANGGIYARSEYEAKNIFLEFIQQNFASIRYNESDIQIDIMTDKNEDD